MLLYSHGERMIRPHKEESVMTKEQKKAFYRNQINEGLTQLFIYEAARTQTTDISILADALENVDLIQEEILRRMK